MNKELRPFRNTALLPIFHSTSMKLLRFSCKRHVKDQLADPEMGHAEESDVDIDMREVYFLIMHFLSAGPCHRTYGQFWNELLEHNLLPRRYHAWYSRSGAHSGDENDDGLSFPLGYNKLVERHPHIEKDHLVKLLKQLILRKAHPMKGMVGGNAPNAADVPTLLGMGSFSLLSHDGNKRDTEVKPPPVYMRWPHMHADQVRGLRLREIGGGFSRHHRAPSTQAACYAIAKPSTMVQKMQNIKKLRGHRNAVYCAVFDRFGRFVITGSDDRLVKIWSMETSDCLASCRGHEGDITDLAVSSNNALVASSSNDCIIRVWRLPDGLPISVLRGHTGAVTAIAFSPRPSAVYQLLSSSDDGTCRLWDARYSQFKPKIYVPRPSDSTAGKSNAAASSSTGPPSHQIFCCAFNASGTVFVTGSSDTLARVWNACKSSLDDSDQLNHEMDVLSGHENDVNYVQFSGCAVASRFSTVDTTKEDNTPKFKNSWFAHDNIVTCSRDGSAIIWIPRSRKSHGKAGHWTRAYHLKVPPPPMPPRPPRGGPRQRVLPTPRGVSMIVWSLDNRFVLAAIMDCRICVWNAADGSLVHSLTGHSESTYVLDVHPFNPRLAMSAGYDGRTIVWDIWEGKPIRIYETGRFKLVDGKFSPDGTSIILSDDVGQLYTLSTGQGESQKEAKYDQFFLGDYRPLIQDTHGNVVDQETQLAPYRRNMQDLLCDSSMIPYPEPYQSMYQRRRLATLGIEWRPSSLRFAVGPDFNLEQDYQILPLADLDVLIDPLPDLPDTMDWEPEGEVQSDNSDSEFNITEEISFGEDEGDLSSSTLGDLECNAEDSEHDNSHKDGLRRSKRKKQKREIEIMTSSGRRVKRKNLDEYDDKTHRVNPAWKSRNGQRKSFSRKSSRPRRAAARNALTLFSKIKGTSPDGEDEDDLEDDSSESESTLQESNFESEELDSEEQSKQSKGKEIVLDDSENGIELHDIHDSHDNDGKRKRLVLKLPVRDLTKILVSNNTMVKFENEMDLVGTSSKVSDGTVARKVSNSRLQGTGHFSGDANIDASERGARKQLQTAETGFELSEGYRDAKIRWGGVRARSSKRMRLGETMSSSMIPPPSAFSICENEKNDNHSIPQGECGLDIENRNEFEAVAPVSLEHIVAGNSEGLKDASTGDHYSLNTFRDCNVLLNEVQVIDSDTVPCSLPVNQVTNGLDDPNWNSAGISTRLRIQPKRTTSDPNSPSKFTSKSPTQDEVISGSSTYSQSPSDLDHKFGSQEPDDHANNVNFVDSNGGQLEGLFIRNANSVLRDQQDICAQKNDRMYSAVYRRSKSCRTRTFPKGDSQCVNEIFSNGRNQNLNEDASTNNVTTDGIWTGSTGVNDATQDSSFLVSRLLDTSEKANKHSLNQHDQLSREEWGSRMTVGLRSTRSRRVNYVRDTSPTDRRKSNHLQRKLSWLMLSMHEGSRYIPQQGDEVAYMRQGHQEYINYSRSSVMGPWEYLKGQIRAVEFCKVVDLEYSTLPGSGDSCCKMKLEFVDPISNVFGRTFKLTLPEVTSFPDFLVERARYEAAIRRNWTVRDKCQVWWKNEDEEDGSWWEGRIVIVKAKSAEFPDSPWERYQIRYKSDPGESHLHSPWELYDASTQWEQPHIDDRTRKKLLSSLAKLQQSGNRAQDNYGVQKLKQVSQKSNFLNRFPVPLSLDVIQSRLENRYYRSLEAMRHDIRVMLSNAESYFGKNGELLAKVKRLSEWFTRMFSSL
ncbi:hypothetical protein Nepgr_010393 [Nepenthes gracilis]|uniref:Bromo domain-containing protein n=1 Tax=Nepenthes gracilis TaxID=150966 RepID=A0AAD3SC53_NEPGR|nr:hypothetical protein Nepgr_010393 [Nepenthes gracilis]